MTTQHQPFCDLAVPDHLQPGYPKSTDLYEERLRVPQSDSRSPNPRVKIDTHLSYFFHPTLRY